MDQEATSKENRSMAIVGSESDDDSSSYSCRYEERSEADASSRICCNCSQKSQAIMLPLQSMQGNDSDGNTSIQASSSFQDDSHPSEMAQKIIGPLQKKEGESEDSTGCSSKTAPTCSRCNTMLALAVAAHVSSSAAAAAMSSNNKMSPPFPRRMMLPLLLYLGMSSLSNTCTSNGAMAASTAINDDTPIKTTSSIISSRVKARKLKNSNNNNDVGEEGLLKHGYDYSNYIIDDDENDENDDMENNNGIIMEEQQQIVEEITVGGGVQQRFDFSNIDSNDYHDNLVDDDNVDIDDVIMEDLLLADYDQSLDLSSGDDDDSDEYQYDDDEDDDVLIGPQLKEHFQQVQPKLEVQSQGSGGINAQSSSYQEKAEKQTHQSSSHPPSTSSSTSNSHNKKKESVIILSTVDGTLAGISRSTGQVLWKQSQAQITQHAHNNDEEQGRPQPSSSTTSDPPIEWNKFLSPLISTTTTKSTAHLSPPHDLHAVPSIDGMVYLTEPGNGNNNQQPYTMSAHISEFVDRAPFVDVTHHSKGFFFAGSRQAMVAAIDESTGELLRVIPKWKQHGTEGEDEELPPSLEGRDVVWIGRLEHTVTVHDLQRGTVDIEFSVAQILSVSEMIDGWNKQPPSSSGGGSMQEENKEGDTNEAGGGDIVTTRRQEEMEMERVFTDYITEALRHPSSGDRVLRLPAPPASGGDESNEDEDEDGDDIFASSAQGRGQRQGGGGSPFLVSTPSGNVAFRDDADSSTVGWVSFDLLHSPVVYAIEARSGRKIRVNMLDDSSIMPDRKSNVDTTAGPIDKNEFTHLMQERIAYIQQSSGALPPGGTMGDDECISNIDDNGECRAVALRTQGSVVGALDNGQIYALPMGERKSQGQLLALGMPQPQQQQQQQQHSVASEMVKVNNNDNAYGVKRHQPPLNMNHATIGFHDHRHDLSADADMGDRQHLHLDAKDKQSCTPASPLYPGCLIGASIMMSNLLDVDGNLDMASVFASSDLDYDLYLDMLAEGNSRKRNTYFHQFMKIMSSWIAPTVALLFVVSFEMGRRERLKAEAAASGNDTDNGIATDETKKSQNGTSKGQGVIQLSDEVLGYGGHGTIVYKGVLDKRQVAVKRLLAMYHASADREISLLIESDGHPNVVRYFMKELRGEFVYLALELCDLSLNDLIVSLSKLRLSRKENFHFSDRDDFEDATKSLLFQIASGVRHIHSLRIVHRDLKPQNILLALRSKKSAASKPEESGGSDSETEYDDNTHTTCSDTNTILEYFKNDEYVPKISDMGLGKQLTGQSSFGLSTLGTGSVGAVAAGDAGAGAGSVGWQAPEVMALRWSPESSSNNDTSESLMEASPLETGASTRTSRSVDIFSLGCIFYCTILPGSHPFGEWYEREANIMKNTPNKADLEFVSPDASDLILSMINRNAKARPTADEVVEHPFFWSLAKRLKFLCELSDRIELCDSIVPPVWPPVFKYFAIEAGAVDIFGLSWEKKLDPELMEASVSRRTYDPSSVRDCLRMIRNKHHHYDELSPKLKSRIGSSTDGLSKYISRAFPRLLMHCYHFCVNNLEHDDSLAVDYKLPIPIHSSTNKSNRGTKPTPVIADLSALDGTKKLETIPDDGVEQEKEDQDEAEDDRSSTPELEDDEEEFETPKPLELDEQAETAETQSPEVISTDQPTPRIEGLEKARSQNDDLTGIVVWSGSNTAKELNCRGWYRSEEEWTQRLDAKLRKRDSNLARCADDPKFRTRLCNHWDVSQGTTCPMRRKNRCIFAHGPVELRVKEGKRHRWGTLVRKDGLCANPKASGGEDTYGAARSIENTRKEQGQWAVDSKQKNQTKGKTKGGKPTPKKKNSSV